jgi:hypothetical protein
MNSHTPDVDPHDISAAIATTAERVRAAVEAGTVPPASASQLAQLLDTIAARLGTTPAEPPEITPDDTSETSGPPS